MLQLVKMIESVESVEKLKSQKVEKSGCFSYKQLQEIAFESDSQLSWIDSKMLVSSEA
jgi:hypothetical protein